MHKNNSKQNEEQHKDRMEAGCSSSTANNHKNKTPSQSH